MRCGWLTRMGARGGTGRVGTWARRILLGALAVVALLVAGKALRLVTLEWRTAGAATEALEDSRIPAQQNAAELRSLVERDLGAPVTHSAEGVRCLVRSADQGWFAAYYYQECAWVTIDYVPVEPEELAAIVTEHVGAGSADQACPRLYLPVEEEDERFGHLPVHAFPPGEAGRGCALPELEAGGGGDVVQPTETIVVEPVAAAALDRSTGWVTVEHQERFFRKELGCGFGVLFCTRPMGEPAMPRVGEG